MKREEVRPGDKVGHWHVVAVADAGYYSAPPRLVTRGEDWGDCDYPNFDKTQFDRWDD